MLIAKLNAESSALPILRKQLDEIEKGIDNLVNAIQAGILTASTKQRLEQLEAEKSEISVQILKEMSPEQLHLFPVAQKQPPKT